MFEDEWVQSVILFGVVIVLITVNILEFRGKRKRDAAELDKLIDADAFNNWLCRKQYLQTQNIEQLLHIVTTVMIAILIAVLIT